MIDFINSSPFKLILLLYPAFSLITRITIRYLIWKIKKINTYTKKNIYLTIENIVYIASLSILIFWIKLFNLEDMLINMNEAIEDHPYLFMMVFILPWIIRGFMWWALKHSRGIKWRLELKMFITVLAVIISGNPLKTIFLTILTSYVIEYIIIILAYKLNQVYIRKKIIEYRANQEKFTLSNIIEAKS